MSERRVAYEDMSREEMLDTVTGYTDDEATEKMTDRTTAVDRFMREASEAMDSVEIHEPEPAPMPEPPAPPSLMSKLKGSVNVPEEFKFADDQTFYTMLRNTGPEEKPYTEVRIYLSQAHPDVVRVV